VITNGNAWASFSVNSGELKIGSSGDGRMFYDSSADAYVMSNVFHQTRLSLSDNLHLPIGYFGLGTSADGRMYYNATDDSFVFTNAFRQTRLLLSDYLDINAPIKTILASNTFLVSAPGGIITTGIIGSGLSYNAATRTLSSTGGSQSPWAQEVNAAGYNLINGGTFVTEAISTGVFTNTGNSHLIGDVTIGGTLGVTTITATDFLPTNTMYFTYTNVASSQVTNFIVDANNGSEQYIIVPNGGVNFLHFTNAVLNGTNQYVSVTLLNYTNAAAQPVLFPSAWTNGVLGAFPSSISRVGLVTIKALGGASQTNLIVSAITDAGLSAVFPAGVSNYLWRSTNVVVTVGVTNATTGLRTNTAVFTPGDNYATLLETNATVYFTNFTGWVAGSRTLYSATIQTGPGNSAAVYNLGNLHGLRWGTNVNNTLWTTLTNNKVYEYSIEIKGTNALQTIIEVQ
jgi:hypothetical protein